MKTGQIALKIFLLIIANEVLDTIAQLLMKRGLSHFSISSCFVPGVGFSSFTFLDGIFLGLGVVVFALTFFMWMMILREADLSVALPLGSLSFILIPVAAMLFLREHVSFFRWIGIVFIVLGIYFVSQSVTQKRNANDA